MMKYLFENSYKTIFAYDVVADDGVARSYDPMSDPNPLANKRLPKHPDSSHVLVSQNGEPNADAVSSFSHCGLMGGLR
jgi:hypothetical protein